MLHAKILLKSITRNARFMLVQSGKIEKRKYF